MSANIFDLEFRMHLRSMVIWSLSTAAVVFVYFSLFPAFAENAAALNETMASFPPEFRAAFGLGELDMSTVMGFFSLTYLIMQILLAIQAANYGFGLVSIEERELTADFLLAKPVSRTRIMTSKLFAALAGLGITQAVAWASAFAFINLFRDGKAYDPQLLARLLAGLIPFQLFFLTVGMAVSLLVRRVRSVTPYAMALGFGMYVLGAFSDLLGESTLEKVTPFKHFDPHYIIKHGNFDPSLVLISVVITVMSLVGSYWLYARRNIPSVT